MKHKYAVIVHDNLIGWYEKEHTRYDTEELAVKACNILNAKFGPRFNYRVKVLTGSF